MASESTVADEVSVVHEGDAPPGPTPPPAPQAGARVTAVDPEDETAYQQRLGSCLRSVRRAQRLRLQDVEERSDGRFKAVVVGSYERGDRAVSAHKLAALAGFYGVPVTQLLPEEEGPRISKGGHTFAIAVHRLRDRTDDPELVPLLRLVRHVQWLRDDYNGQVLSLRADDLRTVAIALGQEPEQLDTWLDERGLLHR